MKSRSFEQQMSRLLAVPGLYWWFIAIMSPTIVITVYYGAIAAPRYQTEAQFIVRTASRPASAGSLSTLMQMTGLSVSNDDVHAVQSFLESRSMVERLSRRIPLDEVYGKTGNDWLSRYPSFLYASTQEDLRDYLSWMITSVYKMGTGLVTLKVQAFNAMDAKRIADEVLSLSEQHINSINERLHSDAIRVAANQVRVNEERLIQAQLEITRFRNGELMIDPASSSVVVTAVIARLTAQASKVQTQILELSASASESPVLPTLRRKLSALQEQISNERKMISSDVGGLASKLAVYEGLVVKKEFAKAALDFAVKSLENAQTESRRQQLYLIRVVDAVVIDTPNEPRRLTMAAKAFGLNLVFGLVGWLLWSGVREHSHSA